MKMKNGLFIFRRDLRLTDNTGLLEAYKQVENLYTCFIFTPEQVSNKNDLVLVLLSGGGSALLPYPVEGLSLQDKILINKQLIESGADIKEINAVRKHLSQIKGGNLLKLTHPSKVHCLILSDVVGDDLSSISSGLTSPDPSTFSKTKDILLKYKLWKNLK